MRMAQIILPDFDNDGNGLEEHHKQLRNDLATTFGGFTAIPATGGWVDQTDNRLYEEDVIAYQIAMEDTPHNITKLHLIASSIGKAAHQLAMGITLPNGEFQVIDTRN